MRTPRTGILLIAYFAALAPVASATAVTAVTAVTAATAATEKNDVLLSGMSPFEDLIELATVGSHSAVASALVEVDRVSGGVAAALPDSAATEFSRLVAGLHSAVAAKDQLQIAGGALECFRLLIDNLQDPGLSMPREVSLLDYAGFKLRVLTAAERHDWQNIRATAQEAAGWWSAIQARVSQPSLRNAFDSAIGGLGDAAGIEDPAMLRFAAQIVLDLVDLLEGDLAASR